MRRVVCAVLCVLCGVCRPLPRSKLGYLSNNTGQSKPRCVRSMLERWFPAATVARWAERRDPTNSTALFEQWLYAGQVLQAICVGAPSLSSVAAA